MSKDRRPADYQIRDRAVEWGEDMARTSFIVQAPAGSGKTTLLVQRYLRLLAQVKEPERVLAITFTRKAEAELRFRVLQALAQAAAGDEPETEPAARTYAMAKVVLDQDAARPESQRWHLAHTPARLRIRTFDALCLELARRMPILSRFGTVPDPTEDAKALAQAAAGLTLQTYLDGDAPIAEHLERLLSHLDNDWNKVQALLTQMLLARAQWRITRDAPPNQAVLDEALSETIAALLSRIAALIPSSITRELCGLCTFAAGNVAPESPIAALKGCDTTFPPADNDLPAWRGLRELLLTGKGQWRVGLTKNQGFPPKGADAKPRKEAMIELLDKLGSHDELRDGLGLLSAVPAGGYPETEVQLVASLHEVLVSAMAEMRVVIGERGVTDFSEISLRAEEALGSVEQPSDLLLRLDLSLDHVLVDELQDTSSSQHRLLLKLTEGWQPGDGRSLFLVGDPMQSIYRFRDAEVGLFVEMWQRQALGNVALEPLGLTVNFRSDAALVNWYNRSFAGIMPNESNAAIGAVEYTPADARPGADNDNGNDQAVHCIAAHDSSDEARLVAQTVKTLRDERPQESIAILVRSRRHLEEILPAVQAVAPVLGEKLLILGEQPAVSDLVALTRALLHPADRLAWLAVLRAPWCGVSRADLLRIAEVADSRSIPQLLQSGLPEMFEGESAAQLARLASVLSEAQHDRHQRPLRDWVETTWQALGGPDTCADEQALASALAWLDKLEQLQDAGDLDDPPGLEEALGNCYAPPNPAADGLLQVMTIHQAKGLEFDHVLLPSLQRKAKSDDKPLLLWHELPRSGHMLVAVCDAAYDDSGDASVYQLAFALNQERKAYELGRLLYVACTRARTSLHLFSVLPKNNPEKTSLLNQLWPVAQTRFKLEQESTVAEPSDAQPGLIMRRLKPGWQPPDLPRSVVLIEDAEPAPAGAAPIEFDWANEPTRVAGIVVHEYLHRIAEEGLNFWDTQRIAAEDARMRQRLRQHGVSSSSLDDARARVARALTRTLSDEAGRWILSSHAQAHSEYALGYQAEGRVYTKVVDRTFVDTDGTRWVIDYKASDTQDDVATFMERELIRYREQLNAYAKLMADLERGQRTVKVALYYPLLGEFRPWTPDLDC